MVPTQAPQRTCFQKKWDREPDLTASLICDNPNLIHADEKTKLNIDVLRVGNIYNQDIEAIMVCNGPLAFSQDSEFPRSVAE